MTATYETEDGELPGELDFDPDQPLRHTLTGYVDALEDYEKACRQVEAGTGRFTDLRMFGDPVLAGRLENNNRRAAARGGEASLTESDWYAIKAAFRSKCAYCGDGTQALAIEHVTPVADGGDSSLENCVPACGPCNSAKGSETVEAWLGTKEADAFRLRHARALADARARLTGKPAEAPETAKPTT